MKKIAIASIVMTDFSVIAERLEQNREVIADVKHGYTSLNSLDDLIESYEQLIKEYVAYRIIIEQQSPENLISNT